MKPYLNFSATRRRRRRGAFNEGNRHRRFGGAMARAVVLAMGLLVYVGRAAEARDSVDGAEWTLENVNIVDVERGRILPRHSIQVRGIRIQAVAPQATVTRNSTARLVDGRGAFVIPGLYDMHAHLDPRGRVDDSKLDALVAAGVLGVRDLGHPLASLESLSATRRRRLEPGLGPRIWFVGPILNAPEPPQIKPPHLEDGTKTARVREIVRRIRQVGASAVKVHDRLTLADYQTIVREAHQEGLRVVGHIPTMVPVETIISSEQWSMEHLGGLTHGLLMACSTDANARARAAAAIVPDDVQRLYDLVLSAEHLNPLLDGFDRGRCISLAEQLQRSNIWQVPNMLLWKVWLSRSSQRASNDDRAARQRLFLAAQEITGILHRSGVPLLVGTDEFGTVQDEMDALVEAGLPILAALQAATLAPARFLGLADTVGAVKPGFDADFVLIEGDPLADLAATRRVLAVVFQGQLRPVSPQWRD